MGISVDIRNASASSLRSPAFADSVSSYWRDITATLRWCRVWCGQAAADQANQSAETPLYAAVSNGHAEVACYLVEAGADKHLATTLQYTPLHVAAEYGFHEIVDFLLSAGGRPTSGHI